MPRKLIALSLLTAAACVEAGDRLPVGSDATMSLLMGEDFIEAHLVMPGEIVPPGLHGERIRSGPRPQPPYVNLLEQSTAFFRFPVESRCHSDDATLVRLVTGLNEDDSLRVEIGETPPAVPAEGIWISATFKFHCDAVSAEQVAWFDFNLFDDMPALGRVTVQVIDRKPAVEGELTAERRRFAPNP